VGDDGGGDAMWVCTTAAVGRNGSRGGMLVRRDGDVFWPAKGGARALSDSGEAVVVGGETSRVIIHIILYMLCYYYCYILLSSCFECVTHPPPWYIYYPDSAEDPSVRASVCVCVCVYVCVRV